MIKQWPILQYQLQVFESMKETKTAEFLSSCHSAPTAYYGMLVPEAIAIFFQGLFNGAGALLKPQGLLLTYGVSEKHFVS